MWRALVVSAVLAFLVGPAAQAHAHQPASCQGRERTTQQFAPFSAAVWNPAHWERGAPPPATIAAQRLALRCAAGPGHRHAMRLTWRRNQKTYVAHRKTMLWRREVEPYYGCTVGGCDFWAIPAWSVNCESGGGAVASNIYGNLVTYPGGSKWQQSLAAYELLQHGTYEEIWLRWETGCTGWPGP